MSARRRLVEVAARAWNVVGVTVVVLLLLEGALAVMVRRSGARPGRARAGVRTDRSGLRRTRPVPAAHASGRLGDPERITPLIVGIGGGTGAGKTVLARLLCQRYANVAVIDQDSYYLDRAHLPATERARLNFDEPSALDHDMVVAHLERLRQGRSVGKPRYDFATHTRLTTVDIVEPAALVILEGLFALWDSRVRPLLGLKLFVTADAELRFIRRLRRDTVERGRDVEAVIDQYLASVRPMHTLHVEPTRQYADLVLSGDDVKRELTRLVAHIDALLERQPEARARSRRV